MGDEHSGELVWRPCGLTAPVDWPLWAKSVDEIGVHIVYLTPEELMAKFPHLKAAMDKPDLPQ